MTIFMYLVRRGIQCSAAILPSMPTLANWSQNWSLSSSCSSLISSSSREATPLAVFGYLNKIRSNQLVFYLLNFIITTIFYMVLAFSFKVFCMDDRSLTKLNTEELNRGVIMASYCFKSAFHKLISKIPHSVNCIFATVSNSALKSKDLLFVKTGEHKNYEN